MAIGFIRLRILHHAAHEALVGHWIIENCVDMDIVSAWARLSDAEGHGEKGLYSVGPETIRKVLHRVASGFSIWIKTRPSLPLRTFGV